MMIRRVIKQGHNTLTITLPSIWAKRFNLKGGSEIEVTEKESSLVLSTKKIGDIKKTEINISNLDNPTIWKYFMAAYRQGYDEILVKFKQGAQFENPYKYFTHYRLDSKYKGRRGGQSPVEFLQNLTNRFVNLEIAEYGKDFVIIRDMSEPTLREFDNSLRRVFFLVQHMAEETLNAINLGKPKLLKSIHDIDINLDKFHDYCIRILNKSSNKSEEKTSLIFTILYLLELIGDEYKNISHHILNEKSPISTFKSARDIALSKKEQIDLLYDLFYNFDIKKINKISEIDFKEYISVKRLYKSTKSENEKELLHHLRIISRYINAISELIIEMRF